MQPSSPTPDPYYSGPDPGTVPWSRSEMSLCYLRLKLDLLAIQSRLGRPEEKPGDLESARHLAHRINNVLTAIQIWDGLERLSKMP